LIAFVRWLLDRAGRLYLPAHTDTILGSANPDGRITLRLIDIDFPAVYTGVLT